MPAAARPDLKASNSLYGCKPDYAVSSPSSARSGVDRNPLLATGVLDAGSFDTGVDAVFLTTNEPRNGVLVAFGGIVPVWLCPATDRES
jgi:hypothetical protein